MTFDDYVNMLVQRDRAARVAGKPATAVSDYCKRAGTTVKYLRIHLIPKRKVPKPPLMARLASASNGFVPKRKVLEHFHGK